MMPSLDSIRRPLHYAKRHGFRATVGRTRLALQRIRAGRWQVVFSCDLSTCKLPDSPDTAQTRVERRRAENELEPQDWLDVVNAWNPKLGQCRLSERFRCGASLWLLKSADHLAGYGWTLPGRTIEPYFFPMGADDVHLFDFFVFPEYRGRRINPCLVNHILARLASENKRRAFIEAASWNTAQLSSLNRTPFVRLGLAWKLSILGKTLVVWSRKEPGAVM